MFGIALAMVIFSVFSVRFIGSSNNRREFWESKVLAIVGSSDVPQCHCPSDRWSYTRNTEHVRYWYWTCLVFPNRYITTSFSKGYKYPLAFTFGGYWFCWHSYTFLSLENTLQPSLSEWVIQTYKIHLVGWVRFKLRASHPWALVHICRSHDLHLLLLDSSVLDG
jgi:hypothetical protein